MTPERPDPGISTSVGLACALAPAVLLAAMACADGDGGVGPQPPEATLAERALSAGLAALPGEPPRPPENPLMTDRVELGQLLFFDPILSGPQDLACSTCHLPGFAFADGRQFSVGAGGHGLGPDRTMPEPPLRPMPRNTPTVFNAGLYGRSGTAPTVNGMMFWSGGAFGIEDQVLNPISADKELRGLAYPKVVAQDSALARLRAIPEYLDRFAAAFPEIDEIHGRDPERLITATTLRRTLAAYVRELVTPQAPLDRFLRGDESALDPSQRAGLELFIGEAGCVDCHSGPLLSDFQRHVLGTRQDGLGRDTTPGDDLGWGETGGTPYAFRTPPLRQVELTAPYFHAGTAVTLDQVIRFKNEGASGHTAVPSDDLDPLAGPLGLSDSEIADLTAFLKALTDRVTVQGPLFQGPARVPSGLEVPK
jgi:cytochrome c peroxidase